MGCLFVLRIVLKLENIDHTKAVLKLWKIPGKV